jgi:hypothetical protein
MKTLETIKVKFKKCKGFGNINKKDFNPDLHEEYSEKPKAAPKKRKSTAKKAK